MVRKLDLIPTYNFGTIYTNCPGPTRLRPVSHLRHVAARPEPAHFAPLLVRREDALLGHAEEDLRRAARKQESSCRRLCLCVVPCACCRRLLHICVLSVYVRLFVVSWLPSPVCLSCFPFRFSCRVSIAMLKLYYGQSKANQSHVGFLITRARVRGTLAVIP